MVKYTRVTKETFGELVKNHSRELSAYAFRKLNVHLNDVADVVQETFFRAANRIGHPENPLGEEGARQFLYLTLKNYVIDTNRTAKKRIRTVQLPGDCLDVSVSRELLPDEAAVNSEELELLHDACNNLTPKYRDVIDLFYFKGLGKRAIAKRLGISKVTPLPRLLRAHESLRYLMGEFSKKIMN